MNKVFEKIIEKLEERRMLHADLAQSDKLTEQEREVQSRFCGCFCKAMEIVKQEAEKCKLYDTISIHTNGLEEGIRCAVCTNQIKSDTGCDGGCCVDENLVKRICDVIHKFECKPYQPKGE